ncbi:MAG: response regulator [Pseudomonadota bacterium]
MTPTILLIEDNEQNRYLATFLLERHGYRVESAPDGLRGIELAQSLAPAIILLDIQLPNMDGYAVARALRNIPALDSTPIIAVTSYAMLGDREKCLAAGCTGYIEKPVNPDTFVTEIGRIAASFLPTPTGGTTRVLIVDDKEENLYYLQTLLTAHGCMVDTARHGAEALNKARRSPPDLVISDLLMPVMDGYTLLRHWKADARLRQIPFIVYTATYTEAADERLARDLGADAFILKPAEPEDFLARLRQVQASVSIAGPLSTSQPGEDESALLKVYSETLIRKLEEKSLQLEEANRALRHDVAERRLAEEKLRHSEALLAIASRLGRMGAWALNLPSRELIWSAEVGAIHDVAAGFVPTVENSIEFYTPESRPLIAQAVRDCMQQGTPFDLMLQIVTAKGRPVWVRSIGEAAQGAGGDILRVQGAIQDITERKLLEEQVRHAQKMEAIGTLASGIAHDFNNIIAVIQGNTHRALAYMPVEHPSHKSLDEIRKATDHARNLVRQILTFSRQQHPERRAIALEPAIKEALNLLRPTFPPEIELVQTVAENLPLVKADPTQLHQVLFNLCTNGWHAIGKRPGRIEIRAEPEAAPATAQGEPARRVHLSVSDTGSGMDEATLERVFDPFFTTKEPGQGTGLGLSMVNGIVRDHEGTIRVTSQPGQGTTFHIYLPACEDATPEPPDTAAAEIQRGHGQHILYLDDNEALVELCTHVFEDLGYRVTGFTNATACITAFRAEPMAYDVLITDLNMPGLSGLDVAKQLLVVRPELRVILVSGYIDEELAETARGVGITHVVDKTSSMEIMAQTIHARLGVP